MFYFYKTFIHTFFTFLRDYKSFKNIFNIFKKITYMTVIFQKKNHNKNYLLLKYYIIIKTKILLFLKC